MSMWHEMFKDAICQPCGKKATPEELAATMTYMKKGYPHRDALHLACATNCLGCGSSVTEVIDISYDEPAAEFLCNKCRHSESPVSCPSCGGVQTWEQTVCCSHGCPEAKAIEDAFYRDYPGQRFNPQWLSTEETA